MTESIVVTIIRFLKDIKMTNCNFIFSCGCQRFEMANPIWKFTSLCWSQFDRASLSRQKAQIRHQIKIQHPLTQIQWDIRLVSIVIVIFLFLLCFVRLKLTIDWQLFRSMQYCWQRGDPRIFRAAHLRQRLLLRTRWSPGRRSRHAAPWYYWTGTTLFHNYIDR